MAKLATQSAVHGNVVWWISWNIWIRKSLAKYEAPKRVLILKSPSEVLFGVQVIIR